MSSTDSFDPSGLPPRELWKKLIETDKSVEQKYDYLDIRIDKMDSRIHRLEKLVANAESILIKLSIALGVLGLIGIGALIG